MRRSASPSSSTFSLRSSDVSSPVTTATVTSLILRGEVLPEVVGRRDVAAEDDRVEALLH